MFPTTIPVQETAYEMEGIEDKIKRKITMINRIKKEQLQARKDKDKLKTGVLTALISEIIAIGKTAGNRETSEEEAIKVIKKFKDNAKDTLGLVKGIADSEDKVKTLETEITIYDGFLPKAVSEEETSIIIGEIIAKLPTPNLGLVMKELKSKHIVGLDMGIANKIIRKKLSL